MKKIYSLTFWISISLVVLFFLAAAAAPRYFSSPQGKNQLVSWINYWIPGEITVEELDLHWFQGQTIRGFSLKEAEGPELVRYEELQTDTSLWHILFDRKNLRKTTLLSPYIKIEKDEKGKERIDKALGRHSQKKNRLPSFKEGLIVREGTLSLVAPESSPITLSHITVDKKADPDFFHLRAETLYGQIQGQISLLVRWEGNRILEALVSNFPVAVLDQWEQTTLFSDILGNTLNGDITLHQEEDHPVTIHAHIESQNVQGELEGRVEQQFLYLETGTQLSLSLSPLVFQKWLSPYLHTDWHLAAKTTATVQIEEGIIPLQDPFSLGKDLHLRLVTSMARAEWIHPQLGSYALVGFKSHLTLNKEIDIHYTAELRGKETSQLEGTLLGTPKKAWLFSFTYRHFPLSFLDMWAPQATQWSRTLLGSTFDLRGEGVLEKRHVTLTFFLEAPHAHIQGNIEGPMEHPQVALEGDLSLFGKTASYLGSSLHLSLHLSPIWENNTFSLPYLEGTLYNASIHTSFKGNLGEIGDSPSFSHTKIQGSGEIFSLALQDLLPQTFLEQGTFAFALNGAQNTLDFDIRAEARQETVSSHTLRGHLALTGWHSDNTFSLAQSVTQFHIACKGVPTLFFSPLVSASLPIPVLLGERIDLLAEGTYAPSASPRGVVDIQALGDDLALTATIEYGETFSIRADKPTRLHWVMTPLRYQALVHAVASDKATPPTLYLSAPTPVDLTIEHLTCPRSWKGSTSAFLCQSGFIGELQVGNMLFKGEKGGEILVLQGVQGAVEGENFTDAISLRLHGNFLTHQIPQQEQAGFSFSGKMLHVWTPEGKFNRQELTLEGELDIDLLPVASLTALLPLEESVRQMAHAVFGTFVNARVRGSIAHLTGPVTIDLKGSNFKAVLPLYLESGGFSLKDYITAEITLTPAVNETFLKDINPLPLEGAYSEHPLKLYIDPEGFFLPLHPFSMRGIRIGRAILDIGKIRVHNKGQIQSLLQFLKAKEVGEDGMMEAWFTPIFLSVHDGIAIYKRFDALLAGNVHIALWGRIDLNKDKVKMTLGIAPTTLQERFQIKGLARQDMFQVKMRGPTDNIQLDWSSAYTRIGIILAKKATGHLGMLVGGIVEQIVSAFGEDPVPPPTTYPFPWESEYPSLPGEEIPQESPYPGKR